MARPTAEERSGGQTVAAAPVSPLSHSRLVTSAASTAGGRGTIARGGGSRAAPSLARLRGLTERADSEVMSVRIRGQTERTGSSSQTSAREAAIAAVVAAVGAPMETSGTVLSRGGDGIVRSRSEAAVLPTNPASVASQISQSSPPRESSAVSPDDSGDMEEDEYSGSDQSYSSVEGEEEKDSRGEDDMNDNAEDGSDNEQEERSESSHEVDSVPMDIEHEGVTATSFTSTQIQTRHYSAPTRIDEVQLRTGDEKASSDMRSGGQVIPAEEGSDNDSERYEEKLIAVCPITGDQFDFNSLRTVFLA